MGRLIGYMANRADQLAVALEHERSVTAPTQNDGPEAWGIGFYHAGEVLHKKRPHATQETLDWASIASDIHTDCAVVHLRDAEMEDYRPENAHPFRMRQWLFVHDGKQEGFAAIKSELTESMPDFLRRNIRGNTDSECIFHLFLSFIHDAGHLDSPDPEPDILFSAVRSTVAMLDRLAAQVRAPSSAFNFLVANGQALIAMRRGAALHWVRRHLGPDDAAGRASRQDRDYVLLATGGSPAPADYEVLGPDSLWCVQRNLEVITEPLQ